MPLFIKRTQYHAAPPHIVCLCGSTSFASMTYQEDLSIWAWANLHLTVLGCVVLTIGCDLKSDNSLFNDLGPGLEEVLKKELDELHKRKIDLADEVLFLNQDDYLGTSSHSELVYARAHGKQVSWAFPSKYEEPHEGVFQLKGKGLFT